MSDIFRNFYNPHIRLIQNWWTLVLNKLCFTKLKTKYLFLKRVCNWHFSSSVQSVQASVSGIKLLDVEFFTLLSVSWVFVEYFFYYGNLHVTDTMALLIKVDSCCFRFVVSVDISFMLWKPFIQHSFGLSKYCCEHFLLFNR